MKKFDNIKFYLLLGWDWISENSFLVAFFAGIPIAYLASLAFLLKWVVASVFVVFVVIAVSVIIEHRNVKKIKNTNKYKLLVAKAHKYDQLVKYSRGESITFEDKDGNIKTVNKNDDNITSIMN